MHLSNCSVIILWNELLSMTLMILFITPIISTHIYFSGNDKKAQLKN
jgi:hypothetical protein